NNAVMGKIMGMTIPHDNNWISTERLAFCTVGIAALLTSPSLEASRTALLLLCKCSAAAFVDFRAFIPLYTATNAALAAGCRPCGCKVVPTALTQRTFSPIILRRAQNGG